MPLSGLQEELARLLAGHRGEDSYLAGGAALHLAPDSLRYSNDLDYFNDSVERASRAFAEDRALLLGHGYTVQVELQLDGYVRAMVRLGEQVTKIEWSHDSPWRFMPAQPDAICGYRLHPVDQATSKVLALVGRDEPRDLLDTLWVHDRVLPLGALVWAAAGKDPGFTPHGLLELLRRRGKVRPEDLRRLHLVAPVEPTALKQRWLAALDEATAFVASRPAEELGCLYYSLAQQRFVQPDQDGAGLVVHHGCVGGKRPDE